MAELRFGPFSGAERPDVRTAWQLYERGRRYNRSLSLEDTVRRNEDFFVGKQWEGVEANDLPTPQFNVLKRVVGFTVASISSDSLSVTASPLGAVPEDWMEEAAAAVNAEFEALLEENEIPALFREVTRNAAVDGDGCTYTWWDPDAPVGFGRKGRLRTEVLSNCNVLFGDVSERRVQEQPYLTVVSRELLPRLQKRAYLAGSPDWEKLRADTEGEDSDGKTTVLLTLWRESGSGEIWGFESTKSCVVRAPFSLGLTRYPITWFSWDYIQDSYHGQAMLTGLLPNQIFINKAWAMAMLSLMKTAFPKVIYDKTRLARWDNRVGSAIGVGGGDMESVARLLPAAQVSPELQSFVEKAVQQTEQSLGATSVALGDAKPENTSAILALQRAAATPHELTRRSLYRSVEELFRIYLDFMAASYGFRETGGGAWFDFSTLRRLPLRLRLDVGASSYYSEIAAMQTLDNLLRVGAITPVQYLERVPEGTVPARRALIEELRAHPPGELKSFEGSLIGADDPVARRAEAGG